MHSLDMCLEEYIAYLHEHPHLAYYEDGVLKYEVVAQKVGEEGSFALQVTSAPHISSLDNMGWVITVCEYSTGNYPTAGCLNPQPAGLCSGEINGGKHHDRL